MERKWTAQQDDAIRARGGTLLVSAAAGSGKTAVLVERIVSRMLDAENPVDADRFLVVTFSNAAAEEMRQRLQKRLYELAARNPRDRRIRKQYLLLEHAHISTIHSFCLDLIRAHSDRLGDLPADFRVADETEMLLLREDAAAQTLEQFYDRKSEPFFGLVELFAGGRDDSRLAEMMNRLYDALRAHPFYKDWAAKMSERYDPDIPAERSVWGRILLEYAGQVCGEARALLRRGITEMKGDPAAETAYREAFLALEEYIRGLETAAANSGWDMLYNLLHTPPAVRLKALRGSEDPARKERIKLLWAAAKDALDELRGRICCAQEQFRGDMQALRPLVEELFALIRRFDENLTALKHRRKVLDFADLEQLALELLVEGPENSGSSSVALETAAQFEEILIDEFQDTNAVQDAIFRAVSRDETNLFYVGDVKQSIYRFRQAMPELFLRKMEQFSPYGGGNFPAKVILGRNFRSSANILAAVNDIFRAVMSPTIGEIEYNAEQELIPGTEEQSAENHPVELLLVEGGDTQDSGELGDKSEREAHAVAQRIRALLDSGETVVEDGVRRPLTPGDIAVIMRSPAARILVYRRVFRGYGLHALSGSTQGFLSAPEVSAAVSLLRVIVNPLRDLPLAAVLMSEFFGFSPDDMVGLRTQSPQDRKQPLYLCLEQRARRGDGSCGRALETIRLFRTLAQTMPADELLARIYERTGYLAVMQGAGDGAVKRGNLRLLIRYAADYEEHHGGGVGGFVRYLDRMEERGADFPAAQPSGDAGAVQIMSVHKSKGLEFPVVIVADTARQFNRADSRTSAILHPELGFSCVIRDVERAVQYTTLPHEALKLKVEAASLSEEMRMLYVAMTRAKSRLIITAADRDWRARLRKLAGQLTGEDKIPAQVIRRQRSMADWLLLPVLSHPDSAELRESLGLLTDGKTQMLSRWQVSVVRPEGAEDSAEEAEAHAEPDPALVSEIRIRAGEEYHWRAARDIPTKLSVSELTKPQSGGFRFSARPSFRSEKGLSPAERGTALHTYMQFADYSTAASDPEAELARLERQGYLTERQAQGVDLMHVRAFFASSLYRRIAQAEAVRRELAFLSNRLSERLGFPPGETVTVQGIADCVFTEDGALVLVDYKTDRVSAPEELVRRYGAQLDVYAEILAESLNLPVKEKVLYSFWLDAEIRM